MRTWAPQGQTPIIRSPGHWRVRSVIGAIAATPAGDHPRLYLHRAPGTVRSTEFIRFLKALRRHLRGPVILLLDRLAVHRSKTTTAYVTGERSWLTLAWFPPYAPELNPIEYLWSASKRKDFANVRPDGLAALDQRIERSFRRIRRRSDLLRGFLKASSLFD